MRLTDLVSILLLLKGVAGAKILALMVVTSHSHHLWNSRYLEALANRGHHITYFSIDEFKNPPKNITQIYVQGGYDFFKDIDFSDYVSSGPYESFFFLNSWANDESLFILQSEGFEKLKQTIKREKFDLIVHDFPFSSFLLGAVDLLGRPPIVGVTAFGCPFSVLNALGNPLSFSSKAHHLSHYPDAMNLLQRADNYFLNLWSLAVEWYFYRKQNEYAKKAFGPHIRSLNEIMADINIIMVNANLALDSAFPAVPGLIPVGGLHIKDPKPLPQDLKTFLDEAKDGVIYFSLGSNILSSTLTQERIDIFKEAFRRLSPVQVLWKFESDSLDGKPSNVLIRKWFPQNDILAHPNVRLFFTHSGLLSTQEALYHGKPIVGVPFLLDQPVNVKKCVERRLGERLNLESLTVENVVAAIKKVLMDPQYADNAKKASAIFRDQREKPLDRAVYWTEYAIRHKGAPHLHYSARKLLWYQNGMLDVMALTLSVVSFVLFCAYKLFVVIAGNGRKRHAKKRD